MAFIFPRHFPGGCVVESEVDPATITVNSTNRPYIFPFTLEEAMFVVWKIQTLKIVGNYTRTDLDQGTGNFVTSSSSCNAVASKAFLGFANFYAAPRMSELVCAQTPWASLGEAPISGDISSFAQAGFWVLPEAPIYLWQDSYYLPMVFSMAASQFGGTPGATTTGSLSFSFGGATKTSSDAKTPNLPTYVLSSFTINMTVTVDQERDPL